MAERKSLCVKFNLDNPIHCKAYEIIKQENSNNNTIYADIVSEAINKYYTHLKIIEDDPYFETRKKDDEFIRRILKKLDEKLEKELPTFLISLISTFAVNVNSSIPISNETTTDEIAENPDIDWDFLGKD